MGTNNQILGGKRFTHNINKREETHYINKHYLAFGLLQRTHEIEFYSYNSQNYKHDMIIWLFNCCKQLAKLTVVTVKFKFES